MDKELKEALIEFVQGTVNTLDEGKEFAVEQAPDVVHQFLVFKAIGGAVALVLCIVIFTLAVIYSRKLYFYLTSDHPDSYKADRGLKRYNDDNEIAGAMVVTVFGLAPALIASCLVGINYITMLLQIAFAPKWFIVQKMVEML